MVDGSRNCLWLMDPVIAYGGWIQELPMVDGSRNCLWLMDPGIAYG